MPRTLREFLGESRTTHELSDFSNTFANATEQQRAQLNRYLPKLLDTIRPYTQNADATIPNAEYTQVVKYNLSQAYEYRPDTTTDVLQQIATIRANSQNPWRAEDEALGFDSDDVNPVVNSPSYAAGKMKKAEQLQKKATPLGKQYLDGFLLIMREWAPLIAFCEDLKTRAVKRQPKPVEDRKAVFQAARASNDTTRIVTDTLTTLTDQLKGEYADAVYDYYVTTAEAYAKRTDAQRDAEEQARRRHFGPAPMITQFDIWEHERSLNGRLLYNKLKSSYKATLRKKANKDAQDMQDQFLYKNVKKLAAILEAKHQGLQGEPKILHMRAGNGVFEGDVQIHFADGSKFMVRNKVVLKWTQYGKPFNQFPTTFHSVVLPDGKAMSLPSEERMNTIFTKA